ncbi:hypothetical protein Emed_003056 [Eimeria media]
MGGEQDPLRELAYFTLLQQQQQLTLAAGGASSSPDATAAAAAAAATAAAATPAAAAAGDAADAGEDAQLVYQLESTRSYDECRQLVLGIMSRASASPSLVAAAALRLAIWGSREFKQQQQQERQGPLRDALERSERSLYGGPAPGRALNEGPLRPYQLDERFLDFKQRIRQALSELLRHIRSGLEALPAVSLVQVLAAAALSRVLPMLAVRSVAAALRKGLNVLPPKELVRALHDYTRCMELEADAYGGINITPDDSDFTQRVLQQLLCCTDTATAALSPKRPTLKTLDPKDITLLLRACDRLSLESPDLMQHIGQLALKKQPSFSPDSWALVVSVFSRMGIPLRGDCSKQKRPAMTRDWDRPPPPKKPVPISQC